MMSSAFQPEDRRPEGPDFAKADESRALQRDLLESVLRETLQSIGEPDALPPAELPALVEVARRFRGERVDVETIAVQLVEAVLRDEFESLMPSSTAWQSMTASIARSLCDDPISRERLVGLWNRLQEGQS